MLKKEIDGVVEYTPRRFGDDRGYFAETFNARTYENLGIRGAFVQDNESLSAEPGTVRGLHFQMAPSPQGKLIRIIRGAALDVAVDLRVGSETFGDHVAVRLDGATGNQLWIPPGFAHGFCTLEPDTLVAYKVTAYHDPETDRCILWTDPELGIDWPVDVASATLSAKDAAAPLLADLGDPTTFF
ncbi:MAG: dTDP-4-dehydrorhamnose 3,5-epimerase [Acidimicrobiales bacterium]|nr:dTDP-4-dehydrorhamnose 3,5-epimerase [Acidimicrobiales bacterium]